MGAPDPAGIPPTPEPPAVPDEMWWSPSLAADPTTLRPGFIVRADGRLTDGRGIGIGRDLPADAVRLVPESEVMFVLDEIERHLAQHAADVAEIDRLREDKRLFQDMFMSATAHNTAVCEALDLSYEAETETVVAAIQKALHPMLMLDSETGAVSLAGAVPDTGQAREVDWPTHFLATGREQVTARVPADTVQARDDVRGWLHERIEAGGDPMLARVLAERDALDEARELNAKRAATILRLREDLERVRQDKAPDEVALPGFLQMQDAIEGALRGAGHDLADMADVVYVATEAVRALLGTDTTPDRLAWISEAAETAAVERQARYQETACARRPAEEAPDHG